ncbi:MAG: DUF1573 domain-containing protein [Verrucomicrobiota bacterium]
MNVLPTKRETGHCRKHETGYGDSMPVENPSKAPLLVGAALCLLLVGLGIVLWFQADDPSAPSAEVESTASKAGGVEQDTIESGGLSFSNIRQTVRVAAGTETAEVEFPLTNLTDAPISIDSLRSGCACLSVKVDQEPIPPRSDAVIIGLFDLTKLRGNPVKSILVRPDRKSRPVVLTTTIEISELYEMTPSTIIWSVGEAAETKVLEFRVTGEQPVRILSAESQRKQVTCEFEVIEEGRLYHLKLTPESTDTPLLGIVRIETDCELEAYARPLAYFTIQR